MTNRAAIVGAGALLLLPCLLLLSACRAGERDGSSSATSAVSLTFDDEPPGAVPAGWRIEGTGQGDAPLAEWSVAAERSAPSPPHVLSLTASPHGRAQVYNLCWNDAIRFRSGRISVCFKAVAGAIDQGGGPIWRVRDAENYYICRANPLEDNFRLYKVVNGTRVQLASAAVRVDADRWHTIEVEHVGNRIICTFNGGARLVATDTALSETGGVGLWTKADARTAFDDLVVLPGHL